MQHSYNVMRAHPCGPGGEEKSFVNVTCNAYRTFTENFVPKFCPFFDDANVWRLDSSFYPSVTIASFGRCLFIGASMNTNRRSVFSLSLYRSIMICFLHDDNLSLLLFKGYRKCPLLRDPKHEDY